MFYALNYIFHLHLYQKQRGMNSAKTSFTSFLFRSSAIYCAPTTARTKVR